MILNEKYTLSNGVEIPKLGLGTWLINDKDAVQAVKDSVKSATATLIRPRPIGMNAVLERESKTAE